MLRWWISVSWCSTISLKCQNTQTQQHNITYQKTWIINKTAVETCIKQSTSSSSRSPLTTEITCNFGFLYHILDGRYLIQLLTFTVEICQVSWLYDAWLWWDNRQYDFSLGRTWWCHLYCPAMSLLFKMLPIFYIPFFYMAISL